MKAWYFTCLLLILCASPWRENEGKGVHAVPLNSTSALSSAQILSTLAHLQGEFTSVTPSSASKTPSSASIAPSSTSVTPSSTSVTPSTTAAVAAATKSITFVNSSTTAVKTTTQENKNTTTTSPAPTPPTIAPPKLCAAVTNATEYIKGDSPVVWLPSSPHILVAAEGQPVNIQCRFCLTTPLPDVHIHWYKDDTPLTSGGGITVYGDTVRMQRAQHKLHEGIYKCSVGIATNYTVSRLVTLIINKERRHVITSLTARNVTEASLKLSWQLQPHTSIFDYTVVQIRVRHVDSTLWTHHRKYVDYISGSVLFEDLEPRSCYIANVSAQNRAALVETVSIMFWTYSCNSTEHYIPAFISKDYSTRRLIGLVTGIAGLFITLFGIYCCLANPACTYNIPQGYSSPVEQEDKQGQKKDEHTHNNGATCARCTSTYYSNGAFKFDTDEESLLFV